MATAIEAGLVEILYAVVATTLPAAEAVCPHGADLRRAVFAFYAAGTDGAWGAVTAAVHVALLAILDPVIAGGRLAAPVSTAFRDAIIAAFAQLIDRARGAASTAVRVCLVSVLSTIVTGWGGDASTGGIASARRAVVVLATALAHCTIVAVAATVAIRLLSIVDSVITIRGLADAAVRTLGTDAGDAVRAPDTAL